MTIEQKRTEAEALARDIATALMLDKTATEVRGPDRIVTLDAGYSVLAVVNGVELWVDVKARP